MQFGDSRAFTSGDGRRAGRTQAEGNGSSSGTRPAPQPSHDDSGRGQDARSAPQHGRANLEDARRRQPEIEFSSLTALWLSVRGSTSTSAYRGVSRRFESARERGEAEAEREHEQKQSANRTTTTTSSRTAAAPRGTPLPSPYAC